MNLPTFKKVHLCNHVIANGPCVEPYNHHDVMGTEKQPGNKGVHRTANGVYWLEGPASGERLACVCDLEVERNGNLEPLDLCPVHDFERPYRETCHCCVAREPVEALLKLIDEPWDGIEFDGSQTWFTVAHGVQLCEVCAKTYIARKWPRGLLGLYYKG